MSDKKIVKVNLFDAKSEEILKKSLFTALKLDSISVKYNQVFMETEDVIYSIDVNDFLNVYKSGFEKIYRDDLGEALKKENIEPGIIRLLYQWLNPAFDELPEKIEEKDKFVERIKKNLKEDKEYFDIFKDATKKQINSLPLAKRVNYFDRLEEFGILDERDRIDLGYYCNNNPEQLEKIFKEKNFSKQDREKILSQAFAIERDRQESIETKKGEKKSFNRRIINLINLFDINQKAEILLNGLITKDEFLKSRITKKDLLSLPSMTFVRVIREIEKYLPDNLKISSKEFVNLYGKNLTGTDLFALGLLGYIEPQDFIEVYEINKALKMTSFEDILDNQDLSAFYSPQLLLKMKESQKFTREFLEKYIEMENFQNDPNFFDIKSKALVEEIKKTSDEYKSKLDILYFYNIGLCSVEVVKQNISEDFIEESFLKKEISEDDLFKYYNENLIGENIIVNNFSEEEILELYKSRKINGNCLKLIKNIDLLEQEYCDRNIEDRDLINLYLNGNLDIKDLIDSLELSEKEIDISSFINESTSYLKIKELFENYVIDYSAILKLNHQGIINDEQLEELKKSLDTKKFFKELDEGKVFKVVTNREGESNHRSHINPVVVEEKDFTSEIELISKLLGKDVENEPYSLIESYNSKGKLTSLNNYRIFGNESLDGIVIFQKSKRENAVYVMSVLQLMYFLNGKENSDGEIEIKDRMKDKAYLKTIEGVSVIEHSKHFARNLVEAASKISPKVKDKIKDEDKKYIKEVEEMIEKMREDYLEEKLRV